jgi:hypothetical protein
MSFAAAPHTAATKVSSDAHVDLLVFGRGKHNHVVITAKSVLMLSVLQRYTLVLQTHTSCYIPLHLVLFCNSIIHLWTTKLSTYLSEFCSKTIHCLPNGVLARHPHNHEPLSRQCVLIGGKVSRLGQQQVDTWQAVLVIEHIVVTRSIRFF